MTTTVYMYKYFPDLMAFSHYRLSTCIQRGENYKKPWRSGLCTYFCRLLFSSAFCMAQCVQGGVCKGKGRGKELAFFLLETKRIFLCLCCGSSFIPCFLCVSRAVHKIQNRGKPHQMIIATRKQERIHSCLFICLLSRRQ